MLLFYTGADQSGLVQKLAEKSLGGYVSSTIIPNGLLNNIFSTLSLSDVQNNTTSIRVIALKNLTNATITGITVYPVIPDGSYIDLQLASSPPFLDGCGKENFELLPNENSLPYYANFSSYSQENPLVLSDPLAPNSSIGIFLLREVNTTNIPNFMPITEDEQGIEDLAEEIEDYQNSNKQFQFNLVVSW